MSTLAMFVFSSIQATLLLAVALLGIAARRQRELADRQAEHGGSVFITDEVDVVAADAELATSAALRALDEADQAQDRAVGLHETRHCGATPPAGAQSRRSGRPNSSARAARGSGCIPAWTAVG
ncbi:hypothetical protein ACQP2F_38000 [Actinoplanes sp. CA-030573]|uniref:hypothetical protein n=1 Tax=Actinoplanes sp. CA-030573 TaxID=3239898 RepID=UPI003D8F3A48